MQYGVTDIDQDSGVQGLNIAFRPPIDWEALQTFIEDVMPQFSD